MTYMYVCMYVCVCVCVYIYIYICICIRSQHWTDALLKHLYYYRHRSNINQILHGRYCVRTVHQHNILYTGHFLERKNYISDPGKHEDKLNELLKKETLLYFGF